MKQRRTIEGAAILAVVLLGLATERCAAEVFIDPTFGVSITSGVQYGTNVDGNGDPVALDLDLYQPTGADLPDKLPAIVLMHGGYFETGSKENGTMALLANGFASRGYVAVSINYRKLGLLPPPPGQPIAGFEDRYPSWLPNFLATRGVTERQYLDTIAAAVADQGAAVNWLAANADALHVDPGAIGVGGFSAGAVSSLALGAGFVDGVTADVGAILTISGGLFGWEQAFGPGDPGVYIVHGGSDSVIPYAESEHLVSALQAAGVPYERWYNSIVTPIFDHDPSLAYAIVDNPDFYRFMLTQLAPVPEPSTLALALAAAAVGFAAVARSRRRTR